MAIELDPACLEPEKEALDLLMKASQYDLVIARSMRLLDIFPGDSDARLAMARAWKAMNRVNESSELLEALITEEPDNGPAQAMLGQINLAQGRLVEADEKFRAAALAFEGDVELYYSWGKTLSLLGMHELALEKFAKAAEIDPYDGDTYEAWGSTLKILGRYQEAAEVYKRAAEYI